MSDTRSSKDRVEEHRNSSQDVELSLLKTLKKLDLLGPNGTFDEKTGAWTVSPAHFKVTAAEVMVKLSPILSGREFDDDYDPKDG